MLELLLTLVILGGGGLFVAKDARNNFAQSKKLISAVEETGNRLLHGPPTSEQQVKMLVEGYASQLDLFRRQLAHSKAQLDETREKIAAELSCAKEAEESAEEFLRKGDEETAKRFFTVAVHAKERAQNYEDYATDLESTITLLDEERRHAETNMEVTKMRQETITLDLQIRDLREAQYNIISSISAQTGGFTALGTLEALAQGAKRDARAAGYLLEMAKESQGPQTGDVRDTAVEAAWTEFRDQILLPPPSEDVQSQEDQEKQES